MKRPLRIILAVTLAAVLALAVGYTFAATPAPTTVQEWCRVVDLATGDEVTVPCHRDPTTTTSTTVAPTTTEATTTVAPKTTSTTSSSTTTTTVAPATTAPTAAPTSTVAPSGGTGDFVATFDGNTGLDRLAKGVYHRDDYMISQRSWLGDHDVSCGSPDTQRTIRRDHPEESFYLCRDHLMTSVGDTSGYSIAWFSPDGDGDGRADVFSSATTDEISWDVNVTDLGNRQWWEVVLVAEGAPFLTAVDWIAVPGGIEAYHPETIAVGKGPVQIYSGGDDRDPLAWQSVCGQFGVDPEGCASKAIRRAFWIRDNNDGTITYGFLGKVYTYAGEFPDSFQVYFKDHNYTPDKDGVPVGHTWHWDNLNIG